MTTTSRRRPVKKIVLIALSLLLVMGGSLLALAPTIVSGMAPGMIESAAAARIKGTVRVSGISVGWFSPTAVGPVRILDPDGKTAAQATIRMPATLWTIVGGRWWNARSLDVGEVEIAGSLDLIRDTATGRTNLEQALDPRVAAKPASPSGSGATADAGALESIKAKLNITSLDATVRDRDAKGVLAPEVGIKGLRGTVDLDYAAKPMTLAARANLSGTPVGGPGAPAMTIKLDASVKPRAGGGAGGWDALSISLDAANVPVGVIDAITGQGGALELALGPSANLRVDARLTGDKAGATVKLVSPMATADLDLALSEGVLSLREPSGSPALANHVSLASTAFLAATPALRDALAAAGRDVMLAAAPGLDITINTLRWPLPPEMLAGGNAKDIPAKQDFRGSGLGMTVRVGAMSGRVAIDRSVATDGKAIWKDFAVDPIELAIAAADLSKPVTITGGTKAMIDSSPAGDVQVRASASGLLSPNGTLHTLDVGGAGTGLHGRLADSIDAEVRVAGMSTALLQPLIAGMGLPVDLRQDVGPSIDLTIQAGADVRDSGLAAPPIDFTLSVNTDNVKAKGTIRYGEGTVNATGEGVTISVVSAAPLARRLLAGPGQAATLELSGVGALTIDITRFSATLETLRDPSRTLAAVDARLGITVSDLGVKPGGLPAEQPVRVTRAVLDARLGGSAPAQVDLTASLTHGGLPFQAAGLLTIDGVAGGTLSKSNPGAARILALKPAGKIEIQNAPRSLANLFSGASLIGTRPDPDGTTPPLTAAVRETIGRSFTLVVETKPDGAAQGATIKLTTENGVVGADLAAKLTDKALVIGTLTAFAGMDPKTVNPALVPGHPRAPRGDGSRAKDAARSAATPVLQLAQPFKLSLASSEPIIVPLKSGSFEPDSPAASDAAIKLIADADIAIDNVPTGADASGAARTANIRIRSLGADVRAPLSGLAPSPGNAKRWTATFGALAARDGRGGDEGATIADISGNVSATMTGEHPDATVTLASIDCAVVENLLGAPGLLTGTLGDTARAVLRVHPTGAGADAATAVIGTLTAPRVSDARIDLTMTADRLAIASPSTITWRPDPAFIDRMAFAPPSTGAPTSSIGVTKSAPITITLARFAVSTGRAENDRPPVGPLKPGVFELDASIVVPSLTLTATTPGSAPTPVTLEGIGLSVRRQAAPDANAPPGGEIVAALSIDRVSEEAAAGTPATGGTGNTLAGRKSTATVHIANFADDRGVPTPDAAVVGVDADLGAFPTALLDRLAHQNGVLVELLGPTFDVQAQGRGLSVGGGKLGDLSRAAGSLRAKVGSPRADAELQGDIQGGMFRQTGPIGVRVTRATPRLIAALAGAVPVVESVEKTPPDEPGRLDSTLLTIPLDGDMSKLSGDLEVAPGVARFTTKSIFGSIIDALGGKAGGAIGQRLDPFKIRADHGVLTYERFKLPIGQFSVETRGTVDLVHRRIDMVTYAPIGALTDKALGQLNTGIAGKLGLFDKLTMVPITTKGPLDSPKTELDLGLFAKEQADKLLKDPGKLIGDVLDLFGKKKSGESDGRPTPAPAPAPVAPTPPKPQPDPAPTPKPKPKRKP
jgi:hypothetical protein